MKYENRGKLGCNHTWEKVDIDDSWKKEGMHEVMRKKSRCVKCGATIIRKVRRRI